MTWRAVLDLDCGCVLQQLHEPHSIQHAEIAVHLVGPCVKHGCRKCGCVPLADHEPDRLCEECGP